MSEKPLRERGAALAVRSHRLCRRRFLGAGAVGLGCGALGLGVLGAWRGAVRAQEATPVSHAGAAPGTSLYLEPPLRRSQDGLLETTFEALPDLTEGLGKMSYEGSIPGPTLRVRPGDRLRIRLVNNLGGRDTNLHVHGLHVSPRDNSDNIFIHVQDGEIFDYEYQIPADHPAGLYWYHPHVHGISREQVDGGLAGAIIVEGGLDDFPMFQDWTDRLLVLQGPFMGHDGPHYWVNGQRNPAVAIRPGETQRWRFLNASANAFFNLTLAGHQFHRIEVDGNPLPSLEVVDRELLGPGERATMLIQGGAPGSYELRSEPWGEGGQAQQAFILASLVVEGDEVAPATLPDTLLPLRDLSDAAIARRRVITFLEQTVDPVFSIDGLGFDPDRVDQTVVLDTVEEWVIRNDSPDWHPFHIHINDFQVMSINGQPIPPRYEDTIGIPPHGEVIIRIPFRDFSGKFVYHCHILVHEDFGMMAVVEVVEPGAMDASGGITVVATGLASPRGMAWDADGVLYVVQAGTGETATSVGPAANLVRIDGGCPVEVASGLPSSFDPFRDVLGPEDVVLLDGQLYVLQGATGLLEEMDPATPNGVYAVEPDGSLRLVADLTAWILANPTALTPGDANELGEPYRMLAGEGGLWVLESNRGELLWVTPTGQVTRVIDLSADHPVWTALAVAPDGGVYAGTLTPSPHIEGSARVVKISPDGEVSDFWTGLSTVTGLVTGPDGSIYALEMATQITPDGSMPPGTGRVVRQTGPDSHEVVVTGLEYPIALELGPDGHLYVALPAYGANDQAGAIVRIDLDHSWPMAMDPSMLADARCPGAVPYVPPGPDATPESLAGMPDHDAATPVAVPGDPNAPSAQAVEISDFAFHPVTLQIPAGTTVTWTNRDAVPHTATARGGEFDSGNLNPGASVSLLLDTAGMIDYACLYHPNMTGTIVVS